MPYDGLCMYAIAAELHTKLIETKIHKIYQPVKDEIVLSFSDKNKSTLLLSANASFARAHLIGEKYDNPDHPPSFCMLLRKYLLGGIVKDIRQKDFDRILILEIETLDEAGCLMHLHLIAEIMGRHSNILLVNADTGKILDAIKHVTKLKTSVREVMPGKTYTFPPNDRLNPSNFEIFSGAERMMFFRDKPLKNAILSVFSGISPQLSSSLLIKNNFHENSAVETFSKKQLLQVSEIIYTFFDHIQGHRSYLYWDGTETPKDFSYTRYDLYNDLRISELDSISEACEQYYAKKRIAGHINENYEPAIKLLAHLITKEEHKLQIRKEELNTALDSEALYRFGNLLLSNLHLMKKGMDSVAVINYFSDPADEIMIPLRIDYTPSQNAQMYFKKYAKAKSAAEHLQKLIEESSDLLYYLSSQHYYLTNAQNAAEAEEVVEELIKREILKKKKTFRKQEKSTPLHYRTKDGFDVFVGKNDRQNDQLTLKSSSKDDIWLHTKDIPGSHVILKTNKGIYSEESLKEAASIAAYHSKACESENVPVDYTYVKYVKKPSGSPLGKVIFTNNKTLYVSPSVPQSHKI
ncbi:MAG: NFACT family protein [Anaerofustis sp.]